MTYLLIFVGGGIGAMARFFTASTALRLARGHVGSWPALYYFPIGTLAVNWLGAFFIGLLVEWFALAFDGKPALGESLRYFLVVGVLGGFTTFSAFSLESYLMWVKGDYLPLMAYILLSVVGTLVMVLLGTALVRLVI
ncbi:MAG: fluoride efflux transporter CrcB [Alphaproteobacteria bacterium]|nr:fluoride efflux transporter CrcB [Alphaproteobacteria bacterium]